VTESRQTHLGPDGARRAQIWAIGIWPPPRAALPRQRRRDGTKPPRVAPPPAVPDPTDATARTLRPPPRPRHRALPPPRTSPDRVAVAPPSTGHTAAPHAQRRAPASCRGLRRHRRARGEGGPTAGGAPGLRSATLTGGGGEEREEREGPREGAARRPRSLAGA
jgi:hypothetical protein